MNPLFKHLMGDAARLKWAGDLGRATQAIQEALGQLPGAAPHVQPSAKRDWVIDVAAREVPGDQGEDEAPSSPHALPGQFLHGTHAELIGTRDYKLYVPAGHEGQALPLVVMLHGCTQNPDDFAAGTGMNEAAQVEGCFVLYPAQSQQANPQGCWNWFKHNHQQRGRGEPALIAHMTREVIQRHGIDPRRVYVAGLSAGGAMAAILGETYPDLFAAVGVHSGLPAGAAQDLNGALAAMKTGGAAPAVLQAPHSTMPTIVFHGDRDITVHPINGQRVFEASAAGHLTQQARTRSGHGHDHTVRTVRDAQGRVVAEHWVVHGAGHAWSGGRPQGSYTDALGPDATREMLRFFKTHPRP